MNLFGLRAGRRAARRRRGGRVGRGWSPSAVVSNGRPLVDGRCGQWRRAQRRSCRASRSPGRWWGFADRAHHPPSVASALRTRSDPRSTGVGIRAWHRSWPCDGILVGWTGLGAVLGRGGIVPAGSGPVESARGTSGRAPVVPSAVRQARARCQAAPRTSRVRWRPWNPSTGSDGRCTTCASRSPTAATSAARTACPRRSSGATTRSCRATRSCRSRRSSARRGRSSGWASRSCGSPAASRSSGATCPTLIAHARRAAHAATADALDLTLTTNGAALRALARPLADAGLRAGHGQPGLARRRRVRGDERRSTSRSRASSTGSTRRSRPA